MKKILKKIVKNLKETYLNKIVGIALLAIGIIGAELGDGTGFLFMLIPAIALFFEKENVIYNFES